MLLGGVLLLLVSGLLLQAACCSCRSSTPGSGTRSRKDSMSRGLMKRSSSGYIASPKIFARTLSSGGGEKGSGHEMEMLVDRSSVRKDLVDFQASGAMIAFGELQLGEKIGFGGSGTVLAGSWRGTCCAIKRLNFMLDKEQARLFRDEIKLLSDLRHPQIIQFLGASYLTPDWYVVTELAERGSLMDVLHGVGQQAHGHVGGGKVQLPPQRLLEMAIDGAKGMNFLHQSGVAHRDLKPANLLVTRRWGVKVCDFGLSRRFDNGEHGVEGSMTANVAGTVAYSAPELLQGERYTEKIDVYSWSLVLWEMAMREQPYKGLGAGRVAMSVVSGMRPQIPFDGSCIGPALSKLIEECWHELPRMRPSFDVVCTRLEEMDGPVEFVAHALDEAL